MYITDQMQRRGKDEVETMGASWRRRMRFEIPVRVQHTGASSDVGDALLELLSFLSEDEYEFTFSQYKHPPTLDAYLDFRSLITAPPPESVLLFSGGLRLLGGAIEEVVRDKRSALLVTHASASTKHKRLRPPKHDRQRHGRP